MRLIECVPNFSEGRDLATVAAIHDAIKAVDGVSVLHVTSDASHNRSVITFVAPYETMVEAAFAGIRVAAERIDLAAHQGVHPRMGAADVVPFIPLDGATMEDCVAVAREVGRRVGEELGIPVFLYEHAATRESRRNLADVRRGGFELLREEIGRNPEREPDYGPLKVHPTAGGVAIGARPFLIAFNAYLGGAENLPVAKQVARTVRTSSGGLPAVKALGLEVDGQAQVSMNLVDIERTPLSVAFAAVVDAARARGVDVTWSEIIGLVPERAVFEMVEQHLRLREPMAEHVLERRMLEVRAGAQTARGFVDAVGSDAAVPGGGSVAAYVGGLSAALIKMVAGLTLKRARFADAHARMKEIVEEAERIATQLSELTERDADAYGAVMRAYQLPRETENEITAREETIREALRHAAEVPLQVAQLCVRVAELATELVKTGTPSAITDVGVAALMTEAACKGAAYNVLVNANGIGITAQELANEAKGLMATISPLTKIVTDAVANELTVSSI